jgi:AcrR family transcriptional regulator
MKSVEPKKPYHHGNLKAVLGRAALQLIGEIGLGAFTLREAARRAGVSHNAPYRHFKKKEDVFAALATEGFHQLNERVKTALASESAPVARLKLAARTYLHFAFENPARFHVMFHATFDRRIYPDYIAAYSDSLALLTHLIEACGTLSTEAAETGGEIVWANVHGIAELGLSGRLSHATAPKLEPLVDTAIDALLRGLPQVLPGKPASKKTRKVS